MKNMVSIIRKTDDGDFDGYVIADKHSYREHGEYYIECWNYSLAKKLLPIIRQFAVRS